MSPPILLKFLPKFRFGFVFIKHGSYTMNRSFFPHQHANQDQMEAYSSPTQRLRQLFIPILALLIALLISSLTAGTHSIPLLLIASGVALTLSLLIKNPWWWHVFHLSIFPAASYFLTLAWSPSTYLWAFLGLILVFAGAIVSRVPLYFSGDKQIQALAELIKPEYQTLVDLGAGIGSAIIPLAQQCPNLTIIAYEIAPLTYLAGRIRTRHFANITWKLERFESAELSQADIVYAFLSTEPMRELWQKASQEMKSGSLFISNSFPVLDVEPMQVLLADTVHPLYVYHPKSDFTQTTSRESPS
ncbi:MAG: hypothetical protein RIR18_1106 [Pseudomonadota bacterium]|jgi:hypothetical protein